MGIKIEVESGTLYQIKPIDQSNNRRRNKLDIPVAVCIQYVSMKWNGIVFNPIQFDFFSLITPVEANLQCT